MDELQETSSAFYKGRKNLLMTDLQKGTTFQLLPFPVQSKFISGKAFPFEDFRPVFYYDHQEMTLDVIYQNEPILYSYDWSSESPVLTHATPLELSNFRENQGWEYGEIFYGKLNSQGLDRPFPGKVQSLEKIGNDFLISYFPSPDNGEQESWLKARRGEGTPESHQRVEEKMTIKTVLFRRCEGLEHAILIISQRIASIAFRT